MKVRVRGGYQVEYQKVFHPGGSVLEVTEDFYRSRVQLFDVVEDKVAEPDPKAAVKEEPNVKAEAMSEADVKDRAMKEPDLRKRKKKNEASTSK